ncbi:MAG: Nramp family divalent metal transporter [Planctomycetes bacterium]|nr:Nramp family divalent metal transporter [Planctomycetota bacterium]
MSMRARALLRIVGPGLLVAATGVGAGDLATAAFTGNALGTAVLWAVVVGAALKLLLTEGLARWQLATGKTLLEGLLEVFGWPFRALFLAYLALWSFFVGAAVMSACGAASHALLPLFEDPEHDKLLYGALHSLVGALLVWRGGYALFERAMGLCVALMSFTVVGCALALGPSLTELASGMLVPRIPRFDDDGLGWTLALMGGVGGTLTILSYGYWIREEGREGGGEIPRMRLDLAVGYAVTALFGLSMVVIGSRVEASGSGVRLLVDLANALERELGSFARWSFLVGAWAAVASTVLGVWQAAPYFLADALRTPAQRAAGAPVDLRSRSYRLGLLAIAVLPTLGLLVDFRSLQRLTGQIGAAVMPALCLALLYLCGRRRTLGAHANHLVVNALLVLALGFFVWAVSQGIA